MKPNKPWILQKQLLQAIQSNDLAMAETLFDQGVDVDTVLYASHLGKPAICICVERGYYEMAELLIRRGCSLSLTTASGFAPLHLAVMYADIKFVELLLRNRANVRALDGMGQTALHVACSRISKVEIVEVLIGMGSHVNKLDDEGRSPLFLACIQGCCSTTSYLLKNGAKVNITDSCGNTPIFYAIVHKSLELVKMLVDAGADVNVTNSFEETPVLCLIKSFDFQKKGNNPDDLSVIDLLIKKGCKLDVTTSLGQTPLHLAVCQRRIKLTQKLLNNGCDVNAVDNLGFTALFYACRDGVKDIALMLVAAGTDLSRQEWLHDDMFVKDCNKDLFEWLLEKNQECHSLSELSIVTVRRFFGPNIESAMEKIQMPTLLKNFITLDAYC